MSAWAGEGGRRWRAHGQGRGTSHMARNAKRDVPRPCHVRPPRHPRLVGRGEDASRSLARAATTVSGEAAGPRSRGRARAGTEVASEAVLREEAPREAAVREAARFGARRYGAARGSACAASEGPGGARGGVAYLRGRVRGERGGEERERKERSAWGFDFSLRRIARLLHDIRPDRADCAPFVLVRRRGTLRSYICNCERGVSGETIKNAATRLPRARPRTPLPGSAGSSR